MFFELVGADEGLFFGLDLLVEGFAGALFGALGDELALDGKLEDGFLHVRREALITVGINPVGDFTAEDVPLPAPGTPAVTNVQRDADDLEGREKAIVDALTQAVGVDRVAEIVDVGNVSGLLRCGGHYWH